MLIKDESTLYLILWKHPDWDSWDCEIRSTENGFVDALRQRLEMMLPSVKILVAEISGSEILGRAVQVDRRAFFPTTKFFEVRKVFETGRPFRIEGAQQKP